MTTNEHLEKIPPSNRVRFILAIILLEIANIISFALFVWATCPKN